MLIPKITVLVSSGIAGLRGSEALTHLGLPLLFLKGALVYELLGHGNHTSRVAPLYFGMRETTPSPNLFVRYSFTIAMVVGSIGPLMHYVLER